MTLAVTTDGSPTVACNALLPVPVEMFVSEVCKVLKRPLSVLSSLVSPLTVDSSAWSACIGRAAISIALLTEACKDAAKLLVPVVVVCGASVASALLRLLLTELVLMET